MKRLFQLIAIVFVSLAVLSACAPLSGPGAYEAGLKANVDQYKLFNDGQLAQQKTLQYCFQYNPQKSECSILTASTNAEQTLAGQPKPLRVAKSVGEIMEAIADKGMDAAKVIYGIDAVTKAIEANAAAMADVSKAGIAAGAKEPLVVRPEVITLPAPAAE